MCLQGQQASKLGPCLPSSAPPIPVAGQLPSMAAAYHVLLTHPVLTSPLLIVVMPAGVTESPGAADAGRYSTNNTTHRPLLPQPMPCIQCFPVLNQPHGHCLLSLSAGVSDVQGGASLACLSATNPASLLMLIMLLFLLVVMPAGVTDGAHTGRYSTTPLLLQPMPQHTNGPALSQLPIAACCHACRCQ
jgi:hypothetical protein